MGGPGTRSIAAGAVGSRGPLRRVGSVRFTGWLLVAGSLLAMAMVSFTCFGTVLACPCSANLDVTSRRQRSWIASGGLVTVGFEVLFLGLAAVSGDWTSGRLILSEPTPAPMPQWPKRG
jgi:hypothetical protein